MGVATGTNRRDVEGRVRPARATLSFIVEVSGSVLSLDVRVTDGRQLFETRVGLSMSSEIDCGWVAQSLENLLIPIADRCASLASAPHGGGPGQDPDLLSSWTDADVVGEVVRLLRAGIAQNIEARRGMRAVSVTAL